MLSKNGVCFKRQLRIQGLIGVTVDDGTVFLVHMNEVVNADDECSSADKPLSNQGSEETSNRSSQFCVDESEQCEAEVNPWSETFKSSTYIKQERQRSHNVKELYKEFHTNTSVQRAEFGDPDHDGYVTHVDSTSDQTSVGSNYVETVASGMWSQRSVPSTADQQGYELSDYSGKRQQPSALGSHAAVHSDTAQYGEALDNKYMYGDMAVTHYFNTSWSQNMPSQSVRMGSSEHKMVFFCN